MHSQKKLIFSGIFVLIGGKKNKRRLGMTDQILLWPQGTVDTNCSVLFRRKRESRTRHLAVVTRRDDFTQVYLFVPAPEFTHLPYQIKFSEEDGIVVNIFCLMPHERENRKKNVSCLDRIRSMKENKAKGSFLPPLSTGRPK